MIRPPLCPCALLLPGNFSPSDLRPPPFAPPPPRLTCIELSEAVEAAAREQEGTPITQLPLGRIRRELEVRGQACLGLVGRSMGGISHSCGQELAAATG